MPATKHNQKKTQSRRSARETTGKRAPANNGAKRALPYVQRMRKIGPIVVWRVDGSYIRTSVDQEFSDYGHHYTFDYIPKDEFWIDQNSPEEDEFFIRHMLTEYRLCQKGTSQDEARQQADQVEAEMRKRAGDVAEAKGENGLADPGKTHLRLLKKLEPGITVWIVNGRLVRSVFDQDFTEGGHEHVYEFVPQNEVWIDDQVTDAERPYIILHELHERNLMSQGMDYDRAHKDSSKLEKRMRHNPEELHNVLADEGWE